MDTQPATYDRPDRNPVSTAIVGLAVALLAFLTVSVVLEAGGIDVAFVNWPF